MISASAEQGGATRTETGDVATVAFAFLFPQSQGCLTTDADSGGRYSDRETPRSNTVASALLKLTLSGV